MLHIEHQTCMLPHSVAQLALLLIKQQVSSSQANLREDRHPNVYLYSLHISDWEAVPFFLSIEGFSPRITRVVLEIRDNLDGSIDKIVRENERVLSHAKWWYIMRIGRLG
jgi:hypothetical protein